MTSQLLTHTPTHSHTLTCTPIQLISRTSEGAGVTSTTKTGKSWKSWPLMRLLCCAEQPFCVCVGEEKCGCHVVVEGVRGSRTGLSIYAPLGPPRRAHREPLWWLGAGLGVFQVFQEDLTLSSAALLFLSNELCFNISQRMTAMCWKETWNVSQNPISSFVGFCILLCFIIFSHCDVCGPTAMAVILTTFHMACSSASSAFYSIHLSHWHRSDETNSKVLSSSDVVVFWEG